MAEKTWGGEPFWGLGYEWDPDWVLTVRSSGWSPAWWSWSSWIVHSTSVNPPGPRLTLRLGIGTDFA